MVNKPERWFREDVVTIKFITGELEEFTFQERDEMGLLVLNASDEVVLIPWHTILFVGQKKGAEHAE